MRRALAVLASIGLATGTIALATPAHSALSNPTCTASLNPPPEPLAAGTSVSLTVAGSCDEFTWFSQNPLDFTVTDGSSTPGINTNTNVSPNDVVTISASAGASGLVVQVTFLNSGTNPNTYFFQVTGGGPPPPPPGPVSSAAGSAPTPVMQQFGMPASGNCEDGYSDSMDWSGVGSGGWGVWWAQWVNDGSGGVVCSRTVMYDTSTSKWTVN